MNSKALIKTSVALIIAMLMIKPIYLIAEEESPDIKLVEKGNKTEKDITKDRIVPLEYANILLKDGREQENPMMIGLAAVTYYATRIDKDYATRILEEATKLARDNADWTALKWLADVWGDKELGPGDIEKSEQFMNEAETLTQIKLRGTKEKKESTLVPKDYLKE